MPQFEKRRFRPAQLLLRLEAGHGWLFRAIDHHRSSQAPANRDRARAQYLSCSEAETILSDAAESIHDEHLGDLGAAQVAGLAAWRMTKGIFRFNPEFATCLLMTPMNPAIKGYVMVRLPQWCVYIEGVEAMSRQGVHGFWAFVDHDETQALTLHLLLEEANRIRHVAIALNASLAEAVDRAAANASRRRADAAESEGEVAVAGRVSHGLATVIEAAAMMLTYLCCTNADVGERGRYPHNPMPVRAGIGWGLFPADRPSLWKVGFTNAARETPGSSVKAKGAMPRFDVREVIRKGGVPDQELSWTDGMR
jgi:hypothetical protein